MFSRRTRLIKYTTQLCYLVERGGGDEGEVQAEGGMACISQSVNQSVVSV